MDFARKQLEKYGWSDGKGLGKNEDGIAKPLKPKLKRSATGFGHDAAAELNDHWWSTLYDRAASNVQVKNKTNISTKDPEAFNISSSSWKISKKLKPSGDMKGFVKKAVLASGGERQECPISGSDSDTDEAPVKALSDEQLFAACSGRTAHKGARHGLRAIGKLARIEEQEKKLLKLPQYKAYTKSIAISENNEDSECKTMKIKALHMEANNGVSEGSRKGKKRNKNELLEPKLKSEKKQKKSRKFCDGSTNLQDGIRNLGPEQFNKNTFSACNVEESCVKETNTRKKGKKMLTENT